MNNLEGNKVFCIGLSRTGTVSLSNALDELGLKCLHFSLEVFVQQEKIHNSFSFAPILKYSRYRKWRLKKETEWYTNKDINLLFKKYQAFSDLPFPLFYKALDSKYPNSKFIYTYRDEEKWLESMHWLYSKGAVIWNQGLLNDEIKFQAYGTAKYDRKSLLSNYRKHHNDVLSYFSGRDDLLCINLDNDELTSENLTKFLGLPVSEKPIRQLNSKVSPTFLQSLIYWACKKVDFFDLVRLIISKTTISRTKTRTDK